MGTRISSMRQTSKMTGYFKFSDFLSLVCSPEHLIVIWCYESQCPPVLRYWSESQGLEILSWPSLKGYFRGVWLCNIRKTTGRDYSPGRLIFHPCGKVRPKWCCYSTEVAWINYSSGGWKAPAPEQGVGPKFCRIRIATCAWHLVSVY